MTDWKSRYDSLQQIHEKVVRRNNWLERRVRYLEKCIEAVERDSFYQPSKQARNGAQRRAERLFEISVHED